MMKVNDFLFDLNIDNVNLFRLERFVEESKLVHKLKMFAERAEASNVSIHQHAKVTEDSSHSSQMSLEAPLRALVAFLQALTHADKDGRIVVEQHYACPSPALSTHSDQKDTKSQSSKKAAVRAQSCMRYVMLNPSVSFREVVAEARSVLLLGGTMQPFEHFTQQLYV